jgi:ATP-dependent DNA helicase RecG
LLRQGMNAIVRNLQRRAVVEGLFRRDVWEYPLEALREALVNALAHRDYSPLARGTPVQVRIFPDRLEVENPGGLFGPVTVERLGEPGLLATRNAHLMRLLEDLPVEDGRVMCENRGTGITAMLETLRAAGMEPPRFDDRHTIFRLIFSNASLLDDATLVWLNRFATYDLNDAQRLGLAYARREGQLTHADYRRLNPGLDSAEVTRHLADLVQRGLLNQHGTRRWTFYTLAEETGLLSGIEFQSEEQAILEYVRAHGSINRSECASLLGVKPARATYLLQVLRDRGVLRREGERRWARYVLADL